MDERVMEAKKYRGGVDIDCIGLFREHESKAFLVIEHKIASWILFPGQKSFFYRQLFFDRLQEFVIANNGKV